MKVTESKKHRLVKEFPFLNIEWNESHLTSRIIDDIDHLFIKRADKLVFEAVGETYEYNAGMCRGDRNSGRRYALIRENEMFEVKSSDLVESYREHFEPEETEGESVIEAIYRHRLLSLDYILEWEWDLYENARKPFRNLTVYKTSKKQVVEELKRLLRRNAREISNFKKGYSHHFVQIIGSSPYGAEDVIVDVTDGGTVKTDNWVPQILHGKPSGLAHLDLVHKIRAQYDVYVFLTSLKEYQEEMCSEEDNREAHSKNIEFSLIDHGKFSSLEAFFNKTGLCPNDYTAESEVDDIVKPYCYNVFRLWLQGRQIKNTEGETATVVFTDSECDGLFPKRIKDHYLKIQMDNGDFEEYFEFQVELERQGWTPVNAYHMEENVDE